MKRRKTRSDIKSAWQSKFRPNTMFWVKFKGQDNRNLKLLNISDKEINEWRRLRDLEVNRRYRQRNPDKVKKWDKARYARRREAHIARNRDYHKKYRPELLEQMRERYRKNREERLAKANKYYWKNRNRILAYKRRRAREQRALRINSNKHR